MHYLLTALPAVLSISTSLEFSYHSTNRGSGTLVEDIDDGDGDGRVQIGDSSPPHGAPTVNVWTRSVGLGVNVRCPSPCSDLAVACTDHQSSN